MAFRIAEYRGYASDHPFAPGIGTGVGYVQSQFSTGLSTGATPTFTLSSATFMVLIDTDQGALINFGSSASTTPTVTSTNGQHIPVNVAPVPFYVSPNTKIYVAST